MLNPLRIYKLGNTNVSDAFSFSSSLYTMIHFEIFNRNNFRSNPSQRSEIILFQNCFHDTLEHVGEQLDAKRPFNDTDNDSLILSKLSSKALRTTFRFIFVLNVRRRQKFYNFSCCYCSFVLIVQHRHVHELITATHVPFCERSATKTDRSSDTLEP